MLAALAFGALLLLPESRPFRMGFTRWPSDLTLEAVTDCQKFVEDHGDIVSVMFMGGIPWTEALEGKPYSADVQANLAYRPPKGKQVFLSISALGTDRKSLCPYWGDKDNMPLPEEWSHRDFDDPKVIQAYTRFALDSVDRMKPEYLAIVIEANILLSKDKARWPKFKVFYHQVYRAVKAKHPTLPVFFTTEVSHYLRLQPEDKGVDQAGEIKQLMEDSDVFAMSLYPYMAGEMPRPLRSDQLAFALSFKKPIAISESGMLTRDVRLPTYKVTLTGSEEEQVEFFNTVFGRAAADRYRFVINFASTDYERLTAKLPAAVAELASIWQYTGIRRSDGVPKPGQKPWDAWLARPLSD